MSAHDEVDVVSVDAHQDRDATKFAQHVIDHLADLLLLADVAATEETPAWANVSRRRCDIDAEGHALLTWPASRMAARISVRAASRTGS